ncbi:MAG: PAS domain-containing protein, partial [Bryobacteraceae bacterium]|nr:PAS domain-containing protein [Bryobacteraceae bacterium]
ALVVAGHLGGRLIMASWSPQRAPMEFWTAAAILVCASGVWHALGRNRLPAWSAVAGIATVLQGISTFAYHVYRIDPFGHQTIDAGPAAAPSTAVCVVLLGSALLAFHTPWLSQFLAAASLVIGMIGFLGFLYDVEVLSDLRNYAAMSIPASVSAILASVATLGMRADRGLMEAVTAPGPARVLTQRFFPLAAIAFLSIHWIGRLGYRYGLYTPGFQSVIVTVVGLVVIACLTWWSVRRIQEAEAARTRAIQRFQAAASAANALIYEWDPASGKVEWIWGFEQLTGYSMQEASPTSQWWLDQLHPEDRERVAPRARGLQAGVTYDVEYRIRRKSGEYLPVRDTFADYRTPGGICVIGHTIDISDQQRREEEQRQINEDLRQFAYAAAHDLQEPLRMVTIFTQLLDKSWPGGLEGQRKEWMQYIVDGAVRMHDLLRDLRAYAEFAQRTPGEPAVGNASAAFHAAVSNLQVAIAESQAEVTSDPLPEVCCPEIALVQMFQNLVGNAIKYRSAAAPRIHVWAERRDGMWMFSVRDNGIGIDPRYATHIFGIFKRLSRSTPGTGMGLAICARVAERHGGRIWVESALGEGSTFRFTLPGKPETGPLIAAKASGG